MRTSGVVTVARSDFGIYLPVLQAIKNSLDLELKLCVAGMHLSPEFGDTWRDIEAAGFYIDERIEFTTSSDTAEGVSKSMGLGMISFGQLFGRWRPDFLMVLGDRFEMLSAAAAALPFAIPLAHVHGGECTEGAIDEAIRHAITKMSHLHFVTAQPHYDRVVQLGEEPWRVTLSGAPSLDSLSQVEPWSREQLEERTGLSLTDPTLLVTLHPVTLEYEQTGMHVAELLAALEVLRLQVVFTYPNADTEGRRIIAAIESFTREHNWAKAVVNFGQAGYFGMMAHAAAMVGNSSSGIIESGSFELPVVNIGTRQRGRVRGVNVVDVDYDRHSIADAVRDVLAPDFRLKLCGMRNLYGDGTAAEKIVDVLAETSIDQPLIMKRFHNVPIGLDL